MANTKTSIITNINATNRKPPNHPRIVSWRFVPRPDGRVLLGSTAEQIVRQAPCDVLVVR